MRETGTSSPWWAPRTSSSPVRTRASRGGSSTRATGTESPRSAIMKVADRVSLAPRGGARFELSIPASMTGARYEVAVFDPTGRHVRSIERGTATAGAHAVEWDLRDDAGGRVRAGVYFVGV